MAQEINENSEVQQIHDQLDKTRLSLSEKMGALQDRMKDTVDTTRETVEETMKSVKDSVQDTVHSVKQIFDIKHQTQKHPLIMLSGTVFLGVFLSHLTDRKSSRSEGTKHGKSEWSGGDPISGWSSGASSSPRREAPEPASSAGPSMKQRLALQFHDELSKMQRVAIGVGAGIFRDWMKKAMPSIATKLEEVIDSATSKMGGEPVDGPVFGHGRNGNGEHAV